MHLLFNLDRKKKINRDVFNVNPEIKYNLNKIKLYRIVREKEDNILFAEKKDLHDQIFELEKNV